METREADNIHPDDALMVTATVYNHDGGFDTTDILVSGRTYCGMEMDIICEHGRIETRWIEYSYNDGKVFGFRDYINGQDVFIVTERIMPKVELIKPTIISTKLDMNDLMKDYTKKQFFPILHNKCY